MAAIVHSIDIDRRPDEVFAYVTDPSKFTEWQAAVVSASAESDGPLQQGSRMVMTRRMGKRYQTMTAELTDVVVSLPRFTSDLAQADESVKKMANFQFDTVVFGHGDPIVVGPDAAVAALAASL